MNIEKSLKKSNKKCFNRKFKINFNFDHFYKLLFDFLINFRRNSDWFRDMLKSNSTESLFNCPRCKKKNINTRLQ